MKCFPRPLVGFLALFTLTTLAQARPAAAADGTWHRFVTGDVVAVVFSDVRTVDLNWFVANDNTATLLPEYERKFVAEHAAAVQAQIDALERLGVGRVYVLLRISDVAAGGPTWVLEIEEGKDPQAVADAIPFWANLLSQLAPWHPGDNPRVQATDGALVVSANQRQMDATLAASAEVRTDVRNAWDAIGDRDFGLLLLGDENSRRVLREMLPSLPGPLAKLDGRLLADGVSWAGAVGNVTNELNLQLIVEGQTRAAAEQIAAALESGIQWVCDRQEVQAALGEDAVAEFRSSLEVEQNEARVSVALDAIFSNAERLSRIVQPPVAAAMEDHYRRQRMNQLKNLARAFLNHEARHRTFPPAASHDENGRPMLSWRVHLLPYLGEQALYEQFRLDEPWDSSHNLPLAERVPEVFQDPNPAISRPLSRKQKTTYVVPVGEETAFPPGKTIQLREITDGLSNTIMLVEVAPARAVVWTQPEDWVVDLAKPLAGVARKDRDYFTAAFCDGHARAMETDIPPRILRLLLQRADGEAIDWP